MVRCAQSSRTRGLTRAVAFDHNSRSVRRTARVYGSPCTRRRPVVGRRAAGWPRAFGTPRRVDRDLASALEGYALLDDETEALVAGIASASDKLSRDLRDARTRLQHAEPGARAAIEAALQRLRASIETGDGT